ncbi:MAG: DEAD/DEAH box helicase, partial [Myxococcaceae bacterium]
MLYIQQSACRILRALFEVALKKQWAGLALKLLELCVMTERRMWRSQCPLRQFSAVPEVICRKLEKISTIGWERYNELSAQDLGELVKMPKMGKTLFKFVHMLPRVKVEALVYPLSRSVLRFEVLLQRDFEYNEAVHGGQILFWVLIEDCDRSTLLHSEPFLLRPQFAEHALDFTVPLLEPRPPHYFLTVTADRWLSSAVTSPVSFRKLSLPAKFPAPSELLDLQLQRVKDLPDPRMRSFFSPISLLNPIQTQCFHAFCEQRESTLLCAPSGAGKSLCAELALLRHLETSEANSKVVYVAANQDLAQRTANDWADKLAALYGAQLGLLTGDQARDLELLKSCAVVVTSPSHWEALSRKWRQRSKAFRAVGLVIFDDMHFMMSSERGAVYEIAVARTRFITAQLNSTARYVGLSCCLANARDLGDLIGCSSNMVFNFAPTARPVPLDIRISSTEELDYASRLQAMGRPIYRALQALKDKERAVVFVPSRVQGSMLAIDLARYSAGNARPLLLASTLDGGADDLPVGANVAVLHEGLDTAAMHSAEERFRSGALRLLIVPYDLVYRISTSADLVVLMDTQVYDGSADRMQDVRVSELWQMTALAGNHAVSGRCLVCCHASRRERMRMLLYDLVPLESQLDRSLHDFLNAEVVARTITSKADAVDFLTWTLYYRRLAQNPHYYSLTSASPEALSDHLSELVEGVVADLAESKCLAVENEMDLVPLNLGMIASFYGVSYTTVEVFAQSVTSKSKTRAVTEILAAAQELALPLRLGEDGLLRALARAVGLDYAPNYERGGAEAKMKKALLCLLAHFARAQVGVELRADQAKVLKQAPLLVQALVDVISSQGWLKPALAAMEVSQCIVQGVRSTDNVLLQVPHFTPSLVEELGRLDPPVETVFDLLDMDDQTRDRAFSFSHEQLSEIALFCNAYPLMQLDYRCSFSGA